MKIESGGVNHFPRYRQTGEAGLRLCSWLRSGLPTFQLINDFQKDQQMRTRKSQIEYFMNSAGRPDFIPALLKSNATAGQVGTMAVALLTDQTDAVDFSEVFRGEYALHAELIESSVENYVASRCKTEGFTYFEPAAA